jgi:hypothetical protein
MNQTKPNESHINWNATPDDFRLIDLISTIFVAYMKEHGHKIDKFQAQMDMTACHLNGHPLKLLQMLLGSNDALVRDCARICNGIDRSNGSLIIFDKLIYSAD